MGCKSHGPCHEMTLKTCFTSGYYAAETFYGRQNLGTAHGDDTLQSRENNFWNHFCLACSTLAEINADLVTMLSFYAQIFCNRPVTLRLKCSSYLHLQWRTSTISV